MIKLKKKYRSVNISLAEGQYQFLKAFYEIYNWRLEDKIDEFCQRAIDKEIEKAMDITREIRS